MHRSASNLPPFFRRGDLFLCRYRIYSLLGAGGFGQVYYAYDHRSHQEVAVKISHVGPLRQEGRLLASVSHPSVPQVYAWGAFEEGWYLVLQYIRGKTVHALIKEAQAEGRGVPHEEVYDIAIQLCGVLAALHEHQPPIIFRDLKPQNMIMTEKSKLYLVDFGIACLEPHRQRLPRGQALIGTPGYLAPEVLASRHISPSMDIYALGRTLHQLLTGRLAVPCTCGSFPCRCASTPLTPLRGPLGQLVMHMLERDVRRRPADAEDLRAVLQELLVRRETEGFQEPETLLGRVHRLTSRYRANLFS